MSGPPDTEDIAHQMLQLGRLLLASGAETEQVQRAVTRFAAAFAMDVHLAVTDEALLLTVMREGHFRTKVGRHLPALAVDLGAIETLNRLVDEVAAGQVAPETIGPRLEAAERPRPAYPRWLTLAAMGLTAASLSRLFGGGWTVFAISLVAGAGGTWVRQELGRHHVNPFLVPFLAALASGALAALAVRLSAPPLPALCLIAQGMILVPGVPLINGVWDVIHGHTSLGLARLGFAACVVVAITFGLFAAMFVTGVDIPVALPAALLPVPEDALFSALAAIGYALLFNVPRRLAWACVLCGLCSHAARTWAAHLGVDLVPGTLIGSLLAGCLAVGFARWFRAPPAAFAFPGVVAMIPGSYAFRGVIGAIALMKAGPDSGTLIAETGGLIVTSALMLLMIAVGVAAPLVLAGSMASGRPGLGSGLRSAPG